MINYPSTEIIYFSFFASLLSLMLIILIYREIKHRRFINLKEINHRAKVSIQEEALRVAGEQIKATKDAMEIFQKGFRVYNQKSKRLKIELEAQLEENKKLSEKNKKLQEKNHELGDELEKMEKDTMLICQSADRLLLKIMKEMYQKAIIIPEDLEKIVKEKQTQALNN